MPCSPSDNTLNPSVTPGIPIPGFGIPFSPVQVDLGFDLPTDLLEDLQEFLSKIKLPFPGLGELQPNLDGATKTILDAIAKILNVIAPFLGLYNLISAALKLFICIIEVLCALMNPFAVASKVKKLFSECLPPFIAILPFAALIAMIIALLLLILALIEYIITVILAIIDAIIRNLSILAAGVTLSDAESTLAAANKIASMLCMIQNILAIMVGVAAIMAVIQALAAFGGGAICDDNDQEGCCPTTLCPPFIKNNFNGISVTNGQLKYFNQIGPDVDTLFADIPLPPGIGSLAAILAFPPLREERFQVYATESQEYDVADIITPIVSTIFPFNFNTFWPEGLSFNTDMPKTQIPYTVDITMERNPDGYGERTFNIKDCYVIRKPYVGVLGWNNIPDLSISSGTFNLEGGLVYEVDDNGNEIPYNIDGEQATLNTFIGTPDTLANVIPTEDDSVTYNCTFTWYPQVGVLAGHQLVTVGCMPEVAQEKAVFNSKMIADGVGPILERLDRAPDGVKVPSTGFLPNVSGAVSCIQEALAAFRLDVSTVGAAEFQAAVQVCLGDLRDQTKATVTDALIKGTSQFNSTISLDTDIQFTTRPIIATVTLLDSSGTVISNNLPEDVAAEVAQQLASEVTLGNISEFTYNGSNGFTAQITSPDSGDGEITVTFDEKVFSTVIQGTGATATAASVSSSIIENVLQYTFVDADNTDTPSRRDAGDTARS